MLNRPFSLTPLLLAITFGLSLPSCSFLRPTPLDEQEQNAKLEGFIGEGGYGTARQFQIQTFNETWWHDGQAVQIALVAPEEPGNYPLIVYLPGLGESADGGRLWREYWAKAGYLVFSVQAETEAKAFAELKAMMPDNMPESGPPDMEDDWKIEGSSHNEPEDDSEDDKLRSSRLARNSELRYIGREFFGPKALEKRIAQTLWAYAQCQQRIKIKQGLFAKGDPSQMLVAGYDLGAQTAAALIGENTGLTVQAIGDFKPLAALIISPSVDPASGKLQERYKNITLPLLTVTAEEDDDPYAITAPKLRTAIWDHAASANKYLLLLKHADHRLLSGSGWSQRLDRQGRHPRGDGFMPGFANQYQGSGRNGGPPGGTGMMGQSYHGDEETRAPVHQQVAAIASVSTAFFDSIAKSDNFAARWLTDRARTWLKSLASLSSK